MNIDRIVNNIQNIQIKDFFLTPDVIKVIRDINNIYHIGAGALGSVYPVLNSNLVVKENSPCQGSPSMMKQRFCQDMNVANQIIRIPHDHQLLLIMPNYLTEGVVGGILNNLSPYTPHFIRTDGVYLSPINRTSYIFMEQGYIDWTKQITSREDAYLFLFQVAHALCIGQQAYRLTHYDLHLGNLVYLEPTSPEYQYHYIYNGSINTVYVRNKFIAKLIDFGFARLESINTIINYMREQLASDTTFGVFNPYYDFMSLIGSIIEHRTSTPLAIQLFRFLGFEGINELLNLIFGISPIEVNQPLDSYAYTKFITDMYYKRWRPKVFDIRPAEDKSFSDIFTITHWLALRLLSSPIMSNQPRSNQFLSTSILSVGLTLLPRVIDILQRTVIDDGIIYENARTTFPTRTYNRTGNVSKPRKDSLMHLIFIDSRKVIPNGYSFKTICCKMDPIVYMENKFGVAINGTFFDINNTYEAIGDYRQLINNTYYETNLPVDQAYLDLYGYVTIEGGIIRIEDGKSVNTLSSNIFMAGPLLIWDGEPLLNDSKMEQTLEYEDIIVKILQCREPSAIEREREDTFLPVNSDYVFNCKQIEPGQLSHGGNANPRTMLILRENIDGRGDVVLVVIEGRTDRSDGADFMDMISVAQRFNAQFAISLDGGRSSNMAWRSVSLPNAVNTIYRTRSYPVGNILALTK